MATRSRKTGTAAGKAAAGKASSKGSRRSTRGSSNSVDGPQLMGMSAAERRKQAQQEARWQAESDLRTLRQADEIRRDPSRLKQAASMAAQEMRALQAVRAIGPGT